MSDKRKHQEDDEELIDINKEYGIKDTDLKKLIETHEKGNVKILKHRLKAIDDAIEKIDDGLTDILYTIDEIMDDYEEGVIFNQEANEAIERLFILTEFTQDLEKKFNSFLKEKENIL